LRARGALGTSELELLADDLDVLQVHHQLLDPLRSALACELSVPMAKAIKSETRGSPYRQ
jgi:hypothetical protein